VLARDRRYITAVAHFNDGDYLAARAAAEAGVVTCFLLTHAEASPSRGGQGESLSPPYIRDGSVSLWQRPGRKSGASLFIHAEASQSVSRGPTRNQCASSYTRKRLSRSRAPGRKPGASSCTRVPFPAHQPAVRRSLHARCIVRLTHEVVHRCGPGRRRRCSTTRGAGRRSGSR